MSAEISLLHATYRRASSPVEVKSIWLERATHPEMVEHIFALDADDASSLAFTEGHRRVVNPGDPTWATTVRNWNAAARAASGSLLVVIADDLFPPVGWDSLLRKLLGPLDPDAAAFAVKLADSARAADTLLRHPVVSRAYFERHGLFSDEFHGVYCDLDITQRAFWSEVILDGRSLALQHRHPSIDSSIPPTASQRRVNQKREYAHGRRVFNSHWSLRHRLAHIRLVDPVGNHELTAARLRQLHDEFARREGRLFPLRLGRHVCVQMFGPRTWRHRFAQLKRRGDELWQGDPAAPAQP